MEPLSLLAVAVVLLALLALRWRRRLTRRLASPGGTGVHVLTFPPRLDRPAPFPGQPAGQLLLDDAGQLSFLDPASTTPRPLTAAELRAVRAKLGARQPAPAPR